MQTVTKPKVTQLAQGEKLNTKQMEAKAGELLPKHLATIESVLIMMEGECKIDLNGIEHVLKVGDSFIVPPHIIHQINAITDFKAFHIMTNDIEFEFFK